MRPNQDLRVSLSPLARLAVPALVGVLLAAVPTAPALAARAQSDSSASVDDDHAPITALREQLVTRRHDASERLRGLVRAALQHTAARMHEARDGMERVMAIGYGLEGLADVDASEAAEQERERPRRFEYVEGTDDPLAGL